MVTTRALSVWCGLMLASQVGLTYRPGTTTPAGARATGLSISAPNHQVAHRSPGAVIAGTIIDPAGEPLRGLYVFALNTREPNTIVEPRFGRPSKTPMARTDAMGRYRLFHLSPASYVIVAFAPASRARGVIEAPSSRDVDATLAALVAASKRGVSGGDNAAEAVPVQRVSIAPLFYPGTPRRSAAIPVTLDRGQEQRDISFVFAPVPVASIEGVVLASPDSLAGSAVIRISSADGAGGTGLASAAPTVTRSPGSRADFRVEGVIPGHYVLTAQAAGLFGSAEVEIDGHDTSGVTLAMRPTVTVVGTVERGAGASSTLGSIRIALRSAMGTASDAIAPVKPVAPDATGRFTIREVPPGEYWFDWRGATVDRAWIEAAFVEGTLVPDQRIDLTAASGSSISVRLILTERPSEVTGRILGADGAPTPDLDLALFPADRALWRRGSPLFRLTRSDQTGTFTFSKVPPGRYFLAAGVHDDGSDWQLPEDLARAAQAAVPVTVAGERTVQDVRIVRRPRAEVASRRSPSR